MMGTAPACDIILCDLIWSLLFAPLSGVRIVAVGGEDFHLTHIGTASLSWKDDEGKLHDITTTDALCFPTSPVNVVSVSQLSLQQGDGVSNGDQGT